MKAFNQWIDTFVSEKGIDQEQIIEVEGGVFGTNFIPCGVVIENIKTTSEEEKQQAQNKLKGKIEITRFKGLGEISPDEFKNFIGKDIRLDPVVIGQDSSIEELLKFYMGKNTPNRQEFIIDNLKVEKDFVEEEV